MSEILDSGERRTFDTGAERDMSEGKGRFDLLPMCVLMRLAKHYEKGAIKYKERNWERGIPAHSFADSAMRHIVKYLDGWTDEDHLISAIWNLCGLAWTEEKKPEMMDIQARKKDPYSIADNAKVKVFDKDHIWWKGRQFISLNRVSEMKREWLEEHPDDVADRLKKIAESGE